MGKVIMSGIVPTLKAPVTYKANFADNTWAQIIDACHKNQVPDTWVVGNSKTMLINGTEYQIDIIGKSHDDYADGSGKAPLTFQMHDCYADVNRMNSSNINTTADKLFLLSEIEIFGSVSYSKSGEGTQYDYYKAGNSKVKNRNGGAAYWNERSPLKDGSTQFCMVSNTGTADYGGASSAAGVAFGFCF